MEKLSDLCCSKLLKILPSDCIDLLTQNYIKKCTIYVVIPQFYMAVIGVYSTYEKALQAKADAEKECKYGKIWLIREQLSLPCSQIYMYIMCDRFMLCSTTNYFLSHSKEEVENFIEYYEYNSGFEKTNIDTCLVFVL